jgi:hypothetical protein
MVKPKIIYITIKSFVSLYFIGMGSKNWIDEIS